MANSIQGPITAQVTGSVMLNYLAGTSIDSRFPFFVAEDDQGSPLMFTMGDSEPADGTTTLWATWRDATVPTGFSRASIHPAPGVNVQCFSVSQAKDGAVVVVVAIDDGAGGSRLFVTGAITPSSASPPWATLAWVSRPGGPAGQAIQRLVLGDHIAAHVPPMLLAEVSWQAPDDDPAMLPNPCSAALPPKTIDNTTKIQRFLVETNTAQSSALWQTYLQPSDMRYVLDVALGRLTLDRPRRGTYTLYIDNGCTTRLSFSSIPEPDYSTMPIIANNFPAALRDNTPGAVFSRKLTPPAGATCLSVLPDPSGAGDSGVFVGATDGLYQFRAHNQTNNATATLVRGDAEVQRLSAIVAHQDRQKIALWGLNNNQELVYLSGAQGDTPAWTTPLTLYRNVAHMAPRVNRKRSSDELFVTSSNNTMVAHLWRDPVSTAWASSDQVLPSLDTAQEFQCYTTVIKLLDANKQPVVNQPVRLNASAWSWVMVNGYWMELDSDADHPLELQTDTTGAVTIINKIADLGTAVFTLNADVLDAPVVADPSAQLRQALLAKVTANPDITTWTYPDGTLIVPEGADPDVIQQAQDSLNQLLTQIAPDLPTDGSQAGDGSGDAESAPSAAQAKQAKVVSFSVLGDIGDAIETAAGDVMQFCRNIGDAVYEYVIEPIENAAQKVWQFAVKVGEQVVKFVIRTITEVLEIISWVFQTIGMVLDDIIKFIGFLFSWDDIVNTHKVVANMGKQSLLYFAAMAKGAETVIEGVFDIAIVKAKQLCLAAADLPDQDLQAVAKQAISEADPTSSAAMDWLSNSAGGTFSSYQIQHGGVTNAAPPVSETPIKDAFETVLTVIQNVWDDVKDALTDFGTGLVNLWKSGNFTFKNILLLATDNVIDAALGAVRDILVGVCEVASDLINVLVYEVLCKEVNIPILTGLYNKFAGGSSLTLLDAGALLLAIPTTMVVKLFTGKAPLPNGTQGWDLLGWQDIFPVPSALNKGLQLSVSAKLGDSEAYATYSRIGGMVAQVAQVLYAMLLPLSVYAQEAERKWLGRLSSSLCACLYVIGWGCTFPFDDDDAMWAMDLINWGFSGVVALLSGGSAILFASAAGLIVDGGDELADQLIKLAETFLGPANSVMSVVAGVVLALDGLVSYILELEADDKPAYHSVGWDTEKFAGNLIGGAAFASEGIADLIEQPEILLGTAVAYGVVVYLGFLRNIDAYYNDHLHQAV